MSDLQTMSRLGCPKLKELKELLKCSECMRNLISCEFSCKTISKLFVNQRSIESTPSPNSALSKILSFYLKMNEAAYSHLSDSELDKLCRQNGLSHTGHREDKIKRIEQHYQRFSEVCYQPIYPSFKALYTNTFCLATCCVGAVWTIRCWRHHISSTVLQSSCLPHHSPRCTLCLRSTGLWPPSRLCGLAFLDSLDCARGNVASTTSIH